MKLKIVQQSCLALAVALSLLLPVAAHAGGAGGNLIAKLVPMDNEQVSHLKAGDTVVKVCRGCGALQLIQVDKDGKIDYTEKKCEYCGSENTYLAASKQPIPFKERLKP